MKVTMTHATNMLNRHHALFRKKSDPLCPQCEVWYLAWCAATMDRL